MLELIKKIEDTGLVIDRRSYDGLVDWSLNEDGNFEILTEEDEARALSLQLDNEEEFTVQYVHDPYKFISKKYNPDINVKEFILQMIKEVRDLDNEG